MTNLPIITHSTLTDDSAGNESNFVRPTLEKENVGFSTDDDFLSVVVDFVPSDGR